MSLVNNSSPSSVAQLSVSPLLVSPNSEFQDLLTEGNLGSTLGLDSRQGPSIKRFTQKNCGVENWGVLLIHKVGTGKTISALLMALNSLEPSQDVQEIIIIAPVGIFNGFIGDYRKILVNDEKSDINVINKDAQLLYFKPGIRAILKDYNYDELINDINNKKLSYDFTNKIVIFDEAHRLLTNEIYDSIQASGVMEKHSFLNDTFFKNSVFQAKKAFVLTGTPMQTSPANLCTFGNFLTRSNNFSFKKYGSRGLSLSVLIFILRHYKVILGIGTTLFISFLNPGLAAYIKLYPSVKVLITILLAQFIPVVVTKSRLERLLTFIEYNTERTCNFVIPQVGKMVTSVSERIRLPVPGFGGNKIKKSMKKNLKKSLKKTMKIYKGGADDEGMCSADPSLVEKIMNAIAATIWKQREPEKLADMLILDTNVNDMYRVSSEFEEPSYDMKKLAIDMSDFISIYDYELQDKDCLSGDENNAGEINETLKHNFPLKVLKEVNLNYTYDQYYLNYKFVLNVLTDAEKTMLRQNTYSKIGMDIIDNYKLLLKIGKFLGNYSSDFEKYYTKLDTQTFSQYLVLDRNYQQKEHSCTIQIQAVKQNIFECPKFIDVKEKLQYFSKNDTFPDSSVNQPHSYTDAVTREKKRYLPLVYSYTEDYGISVFGCYLLSNNMSYILVHKSQKPIKIKHIQDPQDASSFIFVYADNNKPLQFNNLLSQYDKTKIKGKIDADPENFTLLEYNKYIGFTVTYVINQIGTPYCVLLDPTMTEGLNAKYNPAIFVLEPCNSYGDHEQVYGRVLRKYDSGSDKDLWPLWNVNKNNGYHEKFIYQYKVVPFNIKEKGDDAYKEYTKFVNEITKVKRTTDLIKDMLPKAKASFNPLEYVKSLVKWELAYPDIKAWGKIKKEYQNLITFEKNVKYGIYCSDRAYIKKCDERQQSQPGGSMTGGATKEEEEAVSYIITPEALSELNLNAQSFIDNINTNIDNPQLDKEVKEKLDELDVIVRTKEEDIPDEDFSDTKELLSGKIESINLKNYDEDDDESQFMDTFEGPGKGGKFKIRTRKRQNKKNTKNTKKYKKYNK